MQKRNPSNFEIIRTFLWIGLTAFGGVAMSAHIRKHIVDKKKWLANSNNCSSLIFNKIVPCTCIGNCSLIGTGIN